MPVHIQEAPVNLSRQRGEDRGEGARTRLERVEQGQTCSSQKKKKKKRHRCRIASMPL